MSVNQRPRLVVDLGIQFGQVCIDRTRVPAESVAGCVWAGDEIAAVAEDYGVARADVLLACWWVAIHPPHWDVRRLSAWRQWRAWSDDAFPFLAGHGDPSECPDPPKVAR